MSEPWRTHKDPTEGTQIVVGDRLIGVIPQKMDADRIVRAVNLFDDLVDLLQQALTGAPELTDARHRGWYRRAHETYAKATGQEPQS